MKVYMRNEDSIDACGVFLHVDGEASVQLLDGSISKVQTKEIAFILNEQR